MVSKQEKASPKSNDENLVDNTRETNYATGGVVVGEGPEVAKPGQKQVSSFNKPNDVSRTNQCLGTFKKSSFIRVERGASFNLSNNVSFGEVKGNGRVVGAKEDGMPVGVQAERVGSMQSHPINDFPIILHPTAFILEIKEKASNGDPLNTLYAITFKRYLLAYSKADKDLWVNLFETIYPDAKPSGNVDWRFTLTNKEKVPFKEGFRKHRVSRDYPLSSLTQELELRKDDEMLRSTRTNTDNAVAELI
uniref:PH domain-containing protein n=1 Tax=Rhabditophanes sp. KR3021 TaxID=114890 RepID=A0AC35TWE8_9BILA